MTPMSKAFIKMGEINSLQFGPAGSNTDTQRDISVSLMDMLSDLENFPPGAPVRFIITPSDRYNTTLYPTAGFDRAFPVGGVLDTSDSTGFPLYMRNSDTAG